MTPPTSDRTTRHRWSLPFAALAAVTAAAAPGLGAQTMVELGVWGSDGAGLEGDGSGVVGASLGIFPGALGVRGSLGVDADRPALPLGWHPSEAASDWFADLDLVLRVAAGGIEPYVFGGLGTEGRSEAGRMREGTISWGGGVSLVPASFLALQAEARTRRALDRNAWIPRTGWEGRLGLAIRVGGRDSKARRRHRATTARPRAWADAAVLADRPTPERTLHLGDRGDDAPEEAWAGVGAPRARTGASSTAAGILATGETWLGTPYVWGGTDPSGFDCSGFVQRVYRSHGVTLPRVSRNQARAGTRLPVSFEGLEPGDLVFFASNGSRIDHVAIWAGEGMLLHSTRSGGGVRYDRVDSARGRWFRRHLVAARRVL